MAAAATGGVEHAAGAGFLEDGTQEGAFAGQAGIPIGHDVKERGEGIVEIGRAFGKLAHGYSRLRLLVTGQPTG